MLDGIELVGVTLRATGRQAEPGRARGGDAIHAGEEAELQRIDAALFVQHGVAMKARGDELILGGLRQQIARELFNGEFIEGQVGVQGTDDPVAIRPDGSVAILLVAVAVGVAREVEPLARPAFTVMGRGEELVHELFVGVGARILHEGVGLFRRGRKTDQIKIQPAAKREPVRFVGGKQFFLLHPLQHKGVDGVARREVGCGHAGWRDQTRWRESPVRFVFRTGGDPAFQDVLLLRQQRMLHLGGRHLLVLVTGKNACDDRALLRLARHDARVARLAARERRLTQIETQSGLARAFVGSVAFEAIRRQHRTHVAQEVRRIRRASRTGHDSGQPGTQKNPHGYFEIHDYLTPSGVSVFDAHGKGLFARRPVDA